MNKLIQSLSAAVLVLASALATAAEPTAWEKIKAFAHTSKNEAVAEGKKLMAATDKQIAEMKKQASKSAGDTKKAHEANMKDLQAKRQAAGQQLAKMEKSAASTWDATKEGFSNAYKDLSESVDKAKSGTASK
jgi:hypothetical protein